MSRPFIPAPHVASVEWIYSWNGVVCENVAHVLADSDFDTSMCTATWDACKAWWIANMQNKAHGGLSFTRLKVKAQHSDTAPIVDVAILPVQSGTAGGTAIGNNVTFAFKFATGLAGRSARGRWYVTGLGTSIVTNGVSMPAVSAAGFVTAFNNLLVALGDIGQQLCVTSYRHNNAWRPEAVSYPVTSVLYTDLNIDSQRRRLVGRGK